MRSKRIERPTLSEQDEAFLSFGKAMAAWASLEKGFSAWFEHILILDTRIATPLYYSATSFKSRLDLIRAAIQSTRLENDELRFINAAISVAIRYNSFQNRLAHGEFTYEGLIIESKHPDRKIARATAIGRKQLDIAGQNFRTLAQLMWQARDIALGFNEANEDEPTSLEACLERLKELPTTADTPQ